MSVKGIHWAQSVHGVGPFKKCLLLNLGERHHIDSGICTVDQMMLARDSDMSERTARKYLKELEEIDQLITRKMVRSGKGWQTHYVLHFERSGPQDIVGSRKDAPPQKPDLRRHHAAGSKAVSAGTGAPDPSGTGAPDPSGACAPVHIEHEGYTLDSRLKSDSEESDTSKPSRKSKARDGGDDTATLEAFATLWTIWPTKGRERSRSKSCCLDQLRRASKQQPIAAIIAAARLFVGKTEPTYVPGLDRWLKQGRYEHFLPKDLAERAASPTSDGASASPAPEVDWSAMVARYIRSGIWPRHLGDRPDEFGYCGPLAPIDAVFATGRFGMADKVGLKANIDRLRAARAA